MKLYRRSNLNAGIARWEMLLLVLVVAALGLVGMIGLKKGRQSIRNNACLDNLRMIGTAVAMYTGDSAGRLPYAYVRYQNRDNHSWDSFLERSLANVWLTESDGERGATNAPHRKLLVCPQDTVTAAEWAQKFRGQRRSYAMPRHDMKADNWPPGSSNNTGIGLWLDFGATGERKPDRRIYNYERTNQQAAVTMTMIRQPERTLAVTEQINANNILGNSSGAFITRTSDHLGTNSIPAEQHHQGKFNYLMVDGHVELLLPEETVGPKGRAGDLIGGHRGIWTIRADD